MGKSVLEKMKVGIAPELVPMPSRMIAKYGPGNLLIPTPMQVADALRTIQKGEVRTVGQLRRCLAEEAGAQTTCPLCTGIFWRLTAEASEEGVIPVVPYWRMVRDDGRLNDKLPGGLGAQADHLVSEGHQVAAGRLVR